MSHALGAEKRFVVRTDRQQFRAEETVTLSVEAYDENFEPLSDADLPEGHLKAELIIPGNGGAGAETQELAIGMLRQGVFEARIGVYTPGSYTVRVKDDIANKFSEARFEVADLSAERRSAVRNERLQRELAAETNGRSYELTNVAQLFDDLEATPIVETYVRNHALWATPLWFMLVIGLMLSEWLVRKLIHLS
jgi:hypothetical protein